MPAHKHNETFLAGGAVLEIGLENAFDRLRRIIGLHVAIKLASERRLRAVSTMVRTWPQWPNKHS